MVQKAVRWEQVLKFPALPRLFGVVELRGLAEAKVPCQRLIKAMEQMTRHDQSKLKQKTR
ncbi:MAG: hypothetical protein CMP47_15780 [Rickettsiales bacterium]|nr:hypothetical protein [Rickettsiales bacterium]